MIIEVVTRSIANPDDVSRRQFDMYDHAGRTWMAKHSWWAAHAGYSVTTSPVVAMPS
jgi:hypothetical protein